MNEKEARTKWCPMIRVQATPNDATWQGGMLTNRANIPASNTDVLCIGSDCMMWVTDDKSVHHESGKKSCVVKDGHCGLAK